MRDLSLADLDQLDNMILEWQEAAVKAYKADGGVDDWFGVPNFEAQRHWVTLIKHLGPPRYVESLSLSSFGVFICT